MEAHKVCSTVSMVVKHHLYNPNTSPGMRRGISFELVCMFVIILSPCNAGMEM